MYIPGETIAEHGQPADSAYIVLAGSCEVIDDREGNDNKSGEQAPLLFLHTVAPAGFPVNPSSSVRVQMLQRSHGCSMIYLCLSS